MSTPLDSRAALRLRELHRYIMAVDAGRLDEVEEMLAQAESDPGLGRLLDELHAALAAPQAGETAFPPDASRITQPSAASASSPTPGARPADTASRELVFESDGVPATPPARPLTRVGRLASALQAVAAVLVLGALLAGFFALHLARLGQQGGTATGHMTVVRSGLVPNAAGGVLAAGTWDGAVVALRPSDGQLYWRFVSGTGHPVTNIIVQNQVVYANTEYGDIYALRMSDGALLWQRSLGQFEGYPDQFALTSGVVLVAMPDGTHALWASDGAPLWTSKRLFLATAGSIVIMGTMQLGPSSPDSSVSNVDVGSIEALRASDGKVLWTQPTKHAQDASGSGAVSHGTVFVNFSGPDTFIEAFRIADGHPLWTQPDNTGETVLPQVVADQDHVYIAGTRTCALAPRDGTTLWCANSAQADVAISASSSICLASYGSNARSSVLRAVALRAADGRIAWSWNPNTLAAPPGVNNPSGISVGGYNLSLTAGSNTVYFALYGGVYAIRADDGHLLWHAQPHDNYLSLAVGA